MTKPAKTRLLIQAQPGAARNSVSRCQEGVWHISVAAPPVRGKANQELIKFLASTLGVDKRNLYIEKGLTSKRKVISVGGLSTGQVTERLGKLTGWPPN